MPIVAVGRSKVKHNDEADDRQKYPDPVSDAIGDFFTELIMWFFNAA